ncbi:hypothetical protein K439DRAFT_1638913 [Ramaria rubella]|nr:hypothetical protein K439DRAFT_1638913 [Ramaria rubella]
MATEIVILKVSDRFTPELCEKSISFLRPSPPGLQTMRWGRTVEDPNTVMWILNWDTVKAHEDFIKAPIYPTFVATINAFCVAPIYLYHTHVQPFPPVNLFDAGIIEIASIVKKPSVSHEDFAAVNKKHLDLLPTTSGYHCHFSGIMHEDSDVFILLIGWDGVESREAARENILKEHESAVLSASDTTKSSIRLLKLHSQ